MTAAAKSFLEGLEAAAARAEAAEAQYRREAVQRTAQLERERAFAFRRLNLLKAISAAVGHAETEDDAVANGLMLLRENLNWSSVDETRGEVLSRFSPVVAAVFHEVARPEEDSPGSLDGALKEFEAWYLDDRRNSFWVLFEQLLPELPLVEV